jgi:serine/threonine protein kinase/Tol biopolymer transport system component
VPALAQLNAALTGRYRIEREIGAGGMATVYLATDIKHDRRVALKVLNPELGAVLGVERFLSEIRVTANLQHPNLLPLFDSGAAEGLLFYVMPFVEGESLRSRLQKEQQLPVDEAIHIAVAVAGALDYAHQHGVIHRDLKPENILLQSGEPVIADFGIALAVSKAGGQRVTQTGISLGTPHYMSPEQATGDRQIDGRTDIYSLGAVLYEMLGGEPPHTGNTAQAVIARLLTDRPRPVRAMRDTVPEHVEAALDRSLAKLPADRFATAHDFAQALTSGRSVSVPAGVITPGSPRRDVNVSFTIPMDRLRAALPWTLLFVAIGAGAWGWLRPSLERPENTVRFRLDQSGTQRIAESAIGTVFALSPDGRNIVYEATDSLGTIQLYLRPLDQLRSRPIDGTRGARSPVFSPDGQWIAFTLGNELKKVAAEGGPVISLGASGGNGISWGVPGTILTGGVAVTAVPAVGGASREIVKAGATQGNVAYRWPLALPDGETVIYTRWTSSGLPGATLEAASISTGKTTALNLQGTFPMQVLDGLLIYGASNGALMAVPFDAKRLRVTGNPVPVAQDVLIDGPGAAKAAVSPSGMLIYFSGQSITLPQLLDGRGVGQPVTDDGRPYSTPRFSPDGQRIAFTIGTSQSIDIWVYDIPKGTLTRLTTEGSNMRPEWTADGSRILFRSERQKGVGIWWQPADGSGPAEQILKTDIDPFEAILSPDSKYLIYRTSPGAKFSRDIFYVELPDRGEPKPLVVSPYSDQMPRLSPDARWMAYMSDESGQFEIYVRPFPSQGARIQVSTTGGTEPLWSRDGRTLFYRSGNRLMGASVTTVPTFAMTGRRVALEGEFVPNASHQNYDIAPDGKHFLMIKRAGGEAQTIVVHNWLSEVRARIAAKK